MKNVTAFFFLLFFSIAVIKAAEPDSVTLSIIQETQQIVTKLIQNSYQELSNVNIRIQCFHKKGYFFQAPVKWNSLIGKNKTYYIQVNPLVYEKKCPAAGLEAILAHELAHIHAYYTGGFWKIVSIGSKQLFPFSKKRNEHETDVYAIQKGYGNGLIEYRKWCYLHLSKKELRKKKSIYYSPEEILKISTN